MNKISISASSARCCAIFTLAVVSALLAVSASDQEAVASQAQPASYSWQLPSADLSGSGADGQIYGALQSSCAAGEDALNRQWARASGPRTVLLFAAGIQTCQGQMDLARTYYARVGNEYGWDGLGPAQDSPRCSVFKSVASVMAQTAREQFFCADGANPDFKRSARGVDNPLTAADESAPSGPASPVRPNGPNNPNGGMTGENPAGGMTTDPPSGMTSNPNHDGDTDHSTDHSTDHGTDPGTDHGTDPGTDHGADAT